MSEIDQEHRHNYDYRNTEQGLKIRESDSLNIIEFKKLTQKINIFNEKIVDFSDYDVFFNHWSQSFPDEYNEFLSKALDAVKVGALDARHYAKIADIIQVRADFINNFTQYGTNFFIVLCEKDNDNLDWHNFKQNNFYAFSKFNNKNKGHQKWLKQTDKKRKEIFLNKTIESAIVGLNLFKLQLTERSASTSYSFFLSNLPKRIIEIEFCKIYSENPNVIYIFPEDNDINCK